MCPYSYEQLVQLHPDVEDYKLYYAQVQLAASLITVPVGNFLQLNFTISPQVI